MGNMSYCRFENTYQDLEECYEALRNEGGVKGVSEESGDYEKPYIKKLIELCRNISDDFEDDLED